MDRSVCLLGKLCAKGRSMAESTRKGELQNRKASYSLYRYKIAVATVFLSVCENEGIAIESWIGMDLRPVIVEELP